MTRHFLSKEVTIMTAMAMVVALAITVVALAIFALAVVALVVFGNDRTVAREAIKALFGVWHRWVD